VLHELKLTNSEAKNRIQEAQRLKAMYVVVLEIGSLTDISPTGLTFPTPKWDCTFLTSSPFPCAEIPNYCHLGVSDEESFRQIGTLFKTKFKAIQLNQRNDLFNSVTPSNTELKQRRVSSTTGSLAATGYLTPHFSSTPPQIMEPPMGCYSYETYFQGMRSKRLCEWPKKQPKQ
jgi:hypothetical protein